MLNLGLFMMPLHPADKDVSVSYEEDRQLVILADKLHFTEAWMGEHYSSTAEPVTSPLIFNASLISETTNIKFGTIKLIAKKTVLELIPWPVTQRKKALLC